jgi:hypothetical protein
MPRHSVGTQFLVVTSLRLTQRAVRMKNFAVSTYRGDGRGSSLYVYFPCCKVWRPDACL